MQVAGTERTARAAECECAIQVATPVHVAAVGVRVRACPYTARYQFAHARPLHFVRKPRAMARVHRVSDLTAIRVHLHERKVDTLRLFTLYVTTARISGNNDAGALAHKLLQTKRNEFQALLPTRKGYSAKDGADGAEPEPGALFEPSLPSPTSPAHSALDLWPLSTISQRRQPSSFGQARARRPRRCQESAASAAAKVLNNQR